ncbi:hypothetical protein D3C73_1237050 [compost metagenome]
MPGCLLPGGTEERLTQLRQVLRRHPRPMVTHTHDDAPLLTPGAHLDRLPLRIETQGIAQQVVNGTLDQRWPALQRQARLRLQPNVLLWCAELCVLAHAAQQGVEVDRFGVRLLSIDPGQRQNFADQVFQPVTFAGQTRPQGLALLGFSPFGKRQGDAQTRQR